MSYTNVCECEHLYGRIHINDKLISYIMEIHPSGLLYFLEEFLWAFAGNLVEIRMYHIEGSWQRHVQHWTWISGLLWELLVHQLKTAVRSQMEVPIREEFTRCQNIQPMQLHIKYISHKLAWWLSMKSILKKIGRK